MKSSYGSVWLSIENPASSVTLGLTLNGQQINDEVQFFRALVATFYGRGNRSAAIGIPVTRQFGSLQGAEYFLATHFWTLPIQDSLRLYSGLDADQRVLLFANAVIDQIQVGPAVGTSVPLRYVFKVSSPVVEDPPPDLQQPTDDMIKRGTTAITAAADHVDVAFSVPFASPPIVVGNIQRPVGGDQLWAIVRDATVTVNGFTADLSAPAPDGTYKLSWIACA